MGIQEITGTPLCPYQGDGVSGAMGNCQAFLWALSLTFIILGSFLLTPICLALEVQLVLGRASVHAHPVARSSNVEGIRVGLESLSGACAGLLPADRRLHPLGTGASF